MTSERPTDDADADALGPWLDGLSGRPGAGPGHEDGARLRTALAPQAGDAPLAQWRDIEARASAEATDDRLADAAGLPASAGNSRPGTAANDSRPWRTVGWAAALVLAVGVVTLMSQPPAEPDAALRGIGDLQLQGAQWRVERPLPAAEALAADLRGLRAAVTMTVDGEAVVLSIQGPPDAIDPINARLSSLETGLDADGRLRLRIVPLR
jgi:hypothetical protein